MRNQETRGDAMEHEDLRTTESIDDQTTTADVDTDDSDASDAIEAIGREAEVDAEPAEKDMEAATLKTSPGASPFLLESLYFRSFGERALLTREEEITLAKRLDEGSRRIRVALRGVLKVMARAKRTPILLESTQSLQLARGLSGFSATALDKVEQAILSVLKPAIREMKPAATVAKQLKTLLDEIRAARLVLERGKDEMVRCNLRLVVDV
ncbi:MAG: sigma-70 factor domain-containing protein, partial [Nitrospirota bacterium]